MATTLSPPLFQLSGFGPLGLSLDPAHYGTFPDGVWIEASRDPGSGSSESGYLETGGGLVQGPALSGRSARQRLWELAGPSDNSRIGNPTSGKPGESAYVLEFVSGHYRGTKFALRPGQDIVAGSWTGADLVLVDTLVDKKHAKITATECGLRVEDLGSANGTFINGRKVKRANLREGDRILIGRSALLVTVSQDAAGASQGTSERTRSPQTQAPVVSEPGTKPLMSGLLGEHSTLPDLIQFFAMMNKDCVVAVVGDLTGRIYMKQGRIYHADIAEFPDFSPEKALYRIVSWQTGRFELLPPDGRPVPKELKSSTAGLLMEGLRQLDELVQLDGKLPARSARLVLTRALSEACRNLPPEKAAVLALVQSHGVLQTVFDTSPSPDLATAQVVWELIQKKLLKAV